MTWSCNFSSLLWLRHLSQQKEKPDRSTWEPFPAHLHHYPSLMRPPVSPHPCHRFYCRLSASSRPYAGLQVSDLQELRTKRIRGSQSEFSKSNPASLNPFSFTERWVLPTLPEGRQVLDPRGSPLVIPRPQPSHFRLRPKSGLHTDARPSRLSLPGAGRHRTAQSDLVPQRLG